eukprot:1181548-Prorocentrum_minimum.AAC.3
MRAQNIRHFGRRRLLPCFVLWVISAQTAARVADCKRNGCVTKSDPNGCGADHQGITLVLTRLWRRPRSAASATRVTGGASSTRPASQSATSVPCRVLKRRADEAVEVAIERHAAEAAEVALY